MTVDRTKNSETRRREETEAWQNDQDYGGEYDYNFDGTEGVEGGNDFPEYPSGPTQPYSGQTNPYGGGNTGPQSKNLAGGSGLGGPQGSAAQTTLQNLVNQQPPLTNAQIKQQMQAQYGYAPSDADIAYAMGGGTFPDNMGGAYSPYNNTPQGKMFSKAYGTPGFQQWMDGQQQSQDAKSMVRDMKKKESESKVKIHMILLQIMMGDIVGALRSYSLLMERDLRAFSRLIVKKLDGVRKARSMVIRNFARTKPPRAYAGQNPQTAARAQDRSSKYTQFVQMNTQLMNELQNTERELVDALGTQKRDLDNFLQSYASMRDDDKRVSERIMTTR